MIKTVYLLVYIAFVNNIITYIIHARTYNLLNSFLNNKVTHLGNLNKNLKYQIEKTSLEVTTNEKELQSP